MSTINSIRQRWRQGETISDIARKTGVCRDTVYKYINEQDFSPILPVKRERKSKLDPYKSIIEQWLEDDLKCSKKQRHTAKRIHDRLVEEYDVDVSVSTVERYVKAMRLRIQAHLQSNQYLDLVWAPAEAQADFGETDFYYMGTRVRMSYFVLTFPYSNVGFTQVFPGENAECLCQALVNIFSYIGGAPKRIVFDNAAGAGKRICNVVRTTELFERCAAHYGFDYRFCNPYSGHEKGNVENKVGTIRRNFFVPVPQIWNIEIFNKHLLEKCFEFSRKPHWIKGEEEIALFEEDKFALIGLPLKPFGVVRYENRRCDKKGKVQIGGKHFYSTDPALGSQNVVVGIKATTIDIYSEDGTHIVTHARAYGQAPTDTSEPASQLALLARNIGGWQNSRVRATFSKDLQDYLDSLAPKDLRAQLRILRDQVNISGWVHTLEAYETVFRQNGVVDQASLSITVSRQSTGIISYDDPIDLGVYDRLLEVR